MAAEYEGVLDLDELRACGLSAQAVARRARQGRLHRLHEGVYAVGHANVSQAGRFVAAVKACKPDGALSHRAAAASFGFWTWTGGDIDVTIPGGTMRAHPGIRVHRSVVLTRQDLMIRGGVLVTSPVWTVIALAAVLPADELRSAFREALRLKLVAVPSVLAMLTRLGPVRGAKELRRILARALPTRSELEAVVYDLILDGGFEPPDVNVPLRLEGRTVIPDFRWPKQRVVVEADGARWHDNALRRAEDLERQALLERHGETVVRVRWDEATTRPAAARKRFADAGAPRECSPNEA